MDGQTFPELLRNAEQELAEELRRAAIEAEKQRIRDRAWRPWWRRLVDRLPFTITWKTP